MHEAKTKANQNSTGQYFHVFPGSASKLIHILHSTEYPYTSFAVLESGTCLVADSGFDSLLTKLKTFYTPRKAAKIEVHLHWFKCRLQT